MDASPDAKADVHGFWDRQSCGEVYAQGEDLSHYYESHAAERYRLEPYIREFARFDEATGQDVLEIGVGMGADHIEWAKSRPRSLTGIDLTPRAVEHTKKRLGLYGFDSDVRVGDAEALPFADESFDLVFSYGVLHHSPNTSRAIDEVARVLRPGGVARIMIYHKYSLVGYMLWVRYGLLSGRPFRSLNDIYANHLESPGTKAYSVDEARAMAKRFSSASVTTRLGFSDLLEGAVGQRHGGLTPRLARALWPRKLLRTFCKKHGLILFIQATK